MTIYVPIPAVGKHYGVDAAALPERPENGDLSGIPRSLLPLRCLHKKALIDFDLRQRFVSIMFSNDFPIFVIE